MEKKLIKYLLVFLYGTGIAIPRGKRMKRIIIIPIFTFSLLCLLLTITMYIFERREHLQDVVVGFSYLFSCVNCFCSYCIFVHEDQKIRRLLEIIDNGIFTYANEEEIKPNYTWIAKEHNMIRVSLFVSGFVFSNMVLVTLGGIIRLIFTDEQMFLIIPGWVPWDSRVLNFCIQVYLSYLNTFMYTLKWSFSLIISFEFKRQCELLCEALGTVEGRTKSEAQMRESSIDSVLMEQIPTTFMGQNSEKWENFQIKKREMKILRRNIVECIQHHQNVKK